MTNDERQELIDLIAGLWPLVERVVDNRSEYVRDTKRAEITLDAILEKLTPSGDEWRRQLATNGSAFVDGEVVAEYSARLVESITGHLPGESHD